MWMPLRSVKMYGLHLGVPAAGLVSEVDTGLEQLAHRDGRHCEPPAVGSSADPESGAGRRVLGRGPAPSRSRTSRACAPCRPMPGGQ